MQTRTLPDGWDSDLPSWPADEKGIATRKASGAVINAIAAKVPELWGGSADLAESNNSTIEDAPSFIPNGPSTKMWKADPLPAGCCTSASASTAWARSSTASPSMAAPASSAAPS